LERQSVSQGRRLTIYRQASKVCVPIDAALTCTICLGQIETTSIGEAAGTARRLTINRSASYVVAVICSSLKVAGARREKLASTIGETTGPRRLCTAYRRARIIREPAHAALIFAIRLGGIIKTTPIAQATSTRAATGILACKIRISRTGICCAWIAVVAFGVATAAGCICSKPALSAVGISFGRKTGPSSAACRVFRPALIPLDKPPGISVSLGDKWTGNDAPSRPIKYISANCIAAKRAARSWTHICAGRCSDYQPAANYVRRVDYSNAITAMDIAAGAGDLQHRISVRILRRLRVCSDWKGGKNGQGNAPDQSVRSHVHVNHSPITCPTNASMRA